MYILEPFKAAAGIGWDFVKPRGEIKDNPDGRSFQQSCTLAGGVGLIASLIFKSMQQTPSPSCDLVLKFSAVLFTGAITGSYALMVVPIVTLAGAICLSGVSYIDSSNIHWIIRVN